MASKRGNPHKDPKTGRFTHHTGPAHGSAAPKKKKKRKKAAPKKKYGGLEMDKGGSILQAWSKL